MKKRQQRQGGNDRPRVGLLAFMMRSFLALLVLSVQVALPIAPVFADEIQAADTVTETQPAIQTEMIDASPNEDSTNNEPPVVSEQPILDHTESIADTTPVDSVPREYTDPAVSSDADVPVTEVVVPEPEVLGSTETLGEGADTESVPDETLSLTATNTEAEILPSDTETPSTTIPSPANEIKLQDEVADTDTATTSEVIPEEVSTTTPDVQTPTPLEVPSAASSSPESVVVVGESTVTNDENRYTFGVNECARVADGSFYCSSEKKDSANDITNRVFAAPDQDGDNEIFVEKNGTLSQLTYNTEDDAAPFYDPVSDTLVWHRLVDARYQIMALDMKTGVEEQLTRDSYNNMQPARYGDLIVWQGWVGNDWEIMMEVTGEITMLTDNTTHDIGPRINGDYIIWQAEESTGWMVKVYNTKTKQTETISDAEGTSIENPRVVLVYDAKHDNGDVETRGYDLETGKIVPLSQEAPSLPQNIPDPDQTGEKRALISTTTQMKTKTEDDEPDPSGMPPLEPNIDTATTTALGDIVVTPFGDATSSPTTIQGDLSTSSIPDLVIGQVAETIEASTTIELIPDVVVPTFESEMSTSSDPQGEVAVTS